MTRNTSSFKTALFATVVAGLPLASFADPATTYQELCADCHAENRLGAQGPAHVIDILRQDLLANMGQMGIASLDQVPQGQLCD